MNIRIACIVTLAILALEVIVLKTVKALPINYEVVSSTQSPFTLAAIEFSPNGDLWILEAPGNIQIIDSVDGIFFNGNDVTSSAPISTERGVLFDPLGNLIQFDGFSNSATKLDSVDGIFFNGNDVSSTITFKTLLGGGTAEPTNAVFGPDGLVYSTGSAADSELAIWDPINDTFEIFDIGALFGINETFSLTFDPSGALVISSLRQFVTIDPVDGIFFNGNDNTSTINWNPIVTDQCSLSLTDAEFYNCDVARAHSYDILFGPTGNLFMADGSKDQIWLLKESNTPQVVPAPSIIFLLGIGIIGLVVTKFRRKNNKITH